MGAGLRPAPTSLVPAMSRRQGERVSRLGVQIESSVDAEPGWTRSSRELVSGLDLSTSPATSYVTPASRACAKAVWRSRRSRPRLATAPSSPRESTCT